MELELLLKEILDASKTLTHDIKDVQKDVIQGKLERQKVTNDLSNIQISLQSIKQRVEEIEEYLDSKKKSDTEKEGAIKYASLFWKIFNGVIISLITMLGTLLYTFLKK